MKKPEKRTPKPFLLLLFLVLSVIIGLFFLPASLKQQLLDAIEEKYYETSSRPAMMVFFKKGTSETEMLYLADRIRTIKGVRQVKYISQAEAYHQYVSANKEDPLLVELVTADILPASLEIYISEYEALAKVNNLIKQSPLIEEKFIR